MIRMTQVRVPAHKVIEAVTNEDLKLGVISNEEESCIRDQISEIMGIPDDEIHELHIEKKSVDARRKENVLFVYTLTFKAIREHKLVNQYGKNDAFVIPERSIVEENSIMKDVALQISLGRRPKSRPVVVGMGPAGLFAALRLAEAGLTPIIIERGSDAVSRQEKVEEFWQGGELDPETNVQFGEGGAGTFSDGKLNTGIKDPEGRIRFILETFANYGAPSQILYESKPHVGTDRLMDVVLALRERIMALGGEIFFNTRFEEPIINEDNELVGIIVTQDDEEIQIDCTSLVLATGHSARDTFQNLYDAGMVMTSKPFAVGVRVQHSQDKIGYNQYGDIYTSIPACDYRVAHTCASGRGVYSFCMCPGGYVVNASSEEGYNVVNGMSYYRRDSENANSALVVTVNALDYGSNDPLAGMEYQRRLEKLAYEAGAGRIPVQLYGDFLNNVTSTSLGSVNSITKGESVFSNLRAILPEYVNESLIEGMTAFDRKISGFAAEDVIFTGVEARTSSPVRMIRNQDYMSNIIGIYPCGEGAGYAGGITSSAVDGMKVAEKIVETTELE
ncbi:MAG: FAD-dependent oxidoreductase [Lachnospiraceae bacterium]|nr:FAD-dependent oxidoreductase [Lachnospiraceae bacterium]